MAEGYTVIINGCHGLSHAMDLRDKIRDEAGIFSTIISTNSELSNKIYTEFRKQERDDGAI